MRLIDADRIPWQQMHPCHDSLYVTKVDIDRLPTVNGQPPAKKIAWPPRYEHETVTRHGYDGTIVTIEPVVNVRCAHCGNKFYSIVDDMIVGGTKTNYCSSCGEKVDWGDNV